MVTKELESRFKIISDIPTEYVISLPIIFPREEILFTYNFEDRHDNKYLVLHDLYILYNGNVKIKSIEKSIIDEGNLYDGLKGIEAIKIEEKYMSIYEKIREKYLQSDKSVLDEYITLKKYFDSLIKNKTLRDVYYSLYIKFGLIYYL